MAIGLKKKFVRPFFGRKCEFDQISRWQKAPNNAEHD